nr:hypothetical protein [Candidatus Enterousia merdequi]
MKKISIISILSIFVTPVIAEEVTPLITEQNESAVVEEVAQQFEQPEIVMEEPSNPEIHFPHGLQFGVGVSPTSGLNGFIGYNNKKFDSFWAKRFGVRFDFATYSPVKKKVNSKINSFIDDEGVEVSDNLNIDNVSINAKHIGALVDFYPFGDTWFLGGWRLSGGYMTGNLNVNADIHGTLNEAGKIEFELGDRKYVYDSDEMMGKASAKWKYSGPYAGTGFDFGLFWGIKIYLDAGVVFTNNNAKFDLNVPVENLKDITDGDPQGITGDIKDKFNEAKSETLKDIQEDLDKIDFYPIVKLGFMYRF